MFEKVIDCGSWDSMDVQPAVMLKVASDGRIGPNDLHALLEKRAMDHVFADKFASIKLGSDDLPIHLIAVGATEAWGANRNGDGFNERTCFSQYPTFVKHAKFYRDHKNKDEDKSYGKIALAAYNKSMRRIELLLVGNGTKEAAARNGGLVLPSSTVDKFHAGDDIPFSMACKVAFDVCNNCGNKAANRSQYCTEDTCISPNDGFRGLGCLHGLGKVASNGRHQFVENPNCIYFDMSEVVKPADRTAYGGRADYMAKAAASQIMGGAELADWWAAKNGFELQLGSTTPLLKLAHEMAIIEQEIEQNTPTERDLALIRAITQKQAQLDLAPLGSKGTTQAATGLAVLAQQKVALALPDFLRWISGEKGEKLASLVASVAPHVPGVFTRLAADPDLASRARDHVFQPASETLAPFGQRTWGQKLAATHALSPSLVEERIQRSVFRQDSAPTLSVGGPRSKSAQALDGPGEALAQQYGLYKLAFLAAQDQETTQLPLTKRLVILQNNSNS